MTQTRRDPGLEYAESMLREAESRARIPYVDPEGTLGTGYWSHAIVHLQRGAADGFVEVCPRAQTYYEITLYPEVSKVEITRAEALELIAECY